jgi:hypothetical protein
MKPFVGVAAVLALIAFGCDAPLPTRQTDAEFSRERKSIWSARSMTAWKSTHSVKRRRTILGMHTEYAQQRYLMAMATDNAAAECQLRALQSCESLHPGDCIATPDEVRGRR